MIFHGDHFFDKFDIFAVHVSDAEAAHTEGFGERIDCYNEFTLHRIVFFFVDKVFVNLIGDNIRAVLLA